MPVNWVYNLPDNVRSTLVSHDVHNILEMEHVPKLSPNSNRDHIVHGASMPELPNSLDSTLNEQLEPEHSLDSERTQNESTSDGIVQSTDFPNDNNHHFDQLELCCSAIVQSLQSQAREMVDEVMQATSGGSYTQDEEAAPGNQATNGISPDLGAATCDAQLPSNLIMNCTATVLAIKCLADWRHPPANIAGVLERFSAMLRPTCSENLAIYKDIEKYISIITSQTVALVPRTL